MLKILAPIWASVSHRLSTAVTSETPNHRAPSRHSNSEDVSNFGRIMKMWRMDRKWANKCSWEMAARGFLNTGSSCLHTVKNTVSVKHLKQKHNKLWYAYIYFQKSLTDFQLYYLWLITLFETETAQVQWLNIWCTVSCKSQTSSNLTNPFSLKQLES